jgi:glycosyltransferase involved in cell wall biosynthesis
VATVNEITVVVATFDGWHWVDLANDRAIPSAKSQGVVTIHAHDGTLQQARNAALAQVSTEWVVFLDADDELEAGYFDAMAAGTADVRAPSVRYVRPNGSAEWPYVPRVPGHDHDCGGECLPYGNWLVVGSMVRTDLVRSVGGWEDWPLYEDWDLWLRCFQAGATIEAIPRAVYRAHVRRTSRNRAPSPQERLEAHRAIARARGVPIP